MDVRRCKQCDGLVNNTNNRLVSDSCGHMKCRKCLLIEVDACFMCKNEGLLDNIKPIEEEGDKDGAKNGSCPKKKIIKKKRNRMPWPTHVLIENGSDGPTFNCSICKKSFKARRHVHYHAYCSGNTKPLVCPICDKDFVSRSHYEYHMRVHNGYKPFVCEICHVAFYQVSQLKRHHAIHTGEKNFSCKQCDAAFNNAVSLRRHTYIHSGIKPHKCHICSKTFRDSSNLRKHLLKHQEPGVNVTCDVCGKKFSNVGSMVVHTKTHGERTLHCKLCPKSFYTRKDMNRHLAIHSDRKPYKCKLCKLNFRRKDNLDRHLRNTHPDELHNDLIEMEPVEKQAKIENILEFNPLPPYNLEKIDCNISNNLILEANIKRETVIFGPTKVLNNTNQLNGSVEKNDYNDMSYKILKKKMNPIELYRKILETGKEKACNVEEKITNYVHKKVNYESCLFRNVDKKTEICETKPELTNMELYKKILTRNYKGEQSSKGPTNKSTSEQATDNIHWRRRMAMNLQQ